MRFEIKALQQTGVTILYVTHDQEIALGIADRLAVMDEHGTLRQIGTPEEVYERPADDFVFRFLGIANFLPVRREADALHVGNSSERWSGLPPDKPGNILTAGFRPAMSSSRATAKGCRERSAVPASWARNSTT